MVSQTRLINYLASTKIDPTSCRGFEDEAFQALYGLVHYTQGTANQRTAWFQAVWNAHLKAPTGSMKGGPANKNFFYSAVLNRKNSAFGYSLAIPKQGVLEAGYYPWTLDDATFDVLNAEVKANKGPAGGRETSWKDLKAKADKWQDDHGLSTPIAGVGWLVVRALVKRYAPAAVALVGPEAIAVGAAAGYTAVEFNNWTIRESNAAAKADFATDAMRRAYDRGNPIGPAEMG